MVDTRGLHALPVQNGSGVVRMHTVDYEGKYMRPFPAPYRSSAARKCFRALRFVLKQVVFVRRDGIHADLVQVVDHGLEL